MCSGAIEGELKLDIYEGKHVPLSSWGFFAIVHILISEINCIMYQDYISHSFKPFPSRVCNISGSSHAGNVYVFCVCVTKKKGEDSNIYGLDRQKLLILIIKR